MVVVVAFAAEATHLILGVVKSSFFCSGLKIHTPGNGNGAFCRSSDHRCWNCCYANESELVNADKQLAKRKVSFRKGRKNTQKAEAAAASAVVEAQSPAVGSLDEQTSLLESAYRQPVFASSRTSSVDLAQPLIVRSRKKRRLGIESRSSLHKTRIENLMKARAAESNVQEEVQVGDTSDIDIWSLETDILIKDYGSRGTLLLLNWDKLPRKRLTGPEEVRLACYMLPARMLQQVKLDLSEHMKQEPSEEEWAKAAKITVRVLRRYLQSAQAARNKMIEHNLRLVAFQAHKYFKEELSLSLIDLCQEGVPGLVRAVDKFDPEKGYRFSTYAVYWVKNSILRAQAKLGHLIRMPYNVAAQKMQIQRNRALFLEELDREATHQEVMQRMKMESKRYFHVLQTGLPRRSLHARSKMTGDELIHELPEAPEEAEADHYFRAGGARLLRFGMDDVLDSLKPNESLTIRQRYGLDGKGERSFTEIGRNMNLSREMVRKYEIRGMMKLRHPTRVKYLRNFIF